MERKKPFVKSETNNEYAFNEDRLEGRNPVLEALKAGREIDKILVQKGEREGSILKILAMAKEKKIVVQEVEKAKLDSLSSTRAHQGVIAFVAAHEYVEVEDMLSNAKDRREDPFIIILDEVTDPHNLGSVLRTANAVGVHGVIIPKRRSVGLTAAVAKASAGAVEYVPVARVSNLAQTIDKLKKEGLWIAGADAQGKQAFYEADLKGPVAIVIGSEGEGIGRLVKEKCDFLVNIPMKGQISSLNASVAAAVLMYEVVRQREQS
ncbi:MAG: 23S rRNA (guanosine(2251)-2'-O)-methyltransferase RlmB [Clostridiaceae bacterium]|nr:23S rRNA (guanosine(2251)-2'-O)-methyltransferase RlmB [Clostridiaceae bacterium]